jgi:hypothetical protein
MVHGTVNTSGIVGTAAHIHQGAAGQNGPAFAVDAGFDGRAHAGSAARIAGSNSR